MTSTTTRYLLTYLKALGLIGVLFFGALLAFINHFLCLGEETWQLFLYAPVVFPFLLLFTLSKVPSLYWLGRWVVCIPWFFVGWMGDMADSSKPIPIEWVIVPAAIFIPAVLWLTLAHRLAQETLRPGALSLSARLFMRVPLETAENDLGESTGLRRRRLEDLSLLWLSLFIARASVNDHIPFQLFVCAEVFYLISTLYLFSITAPLFLRGLPLAAADSSRDVPSARQLTAYGFALLIAGALIFFASLTGYQHQYSIGTRVAISPVPLALFVFAIPFIFSSIFALSVNLLGCAQLRFTSAIYPPRRYWRTTFAYIAKSSVFALLYLCANHFLVF